MKRSFIFAFVASAMVSTVACQQVEIIPSLNESYSLTLVAEKPSFDGTKTEIDALGTPMWSVGDVIGVYAGNNPLQFSTDIVSPAATASFKAGTYSSSAGTIYAFYPYYKNNVVLNKVSVPFKCVQTPSLVSFDGYSDVLVSKPISTDGLNLQSTKTVSNVQFRRLGAVVKLVLSDPSSSVAGEQIMSVTMQADEYLTGDAVVDLENCSLDGFSGGQQKSVKAIYPFETNTINGANAVYFVVYPQTLTSGSTLTISGETSGHTFTKDIVISRDIDLKAGAITTLRASIANVVAKPAVTNRAIYTVTTYSSVSSVGEPGGSSAQFSNTNTSNKEQIPSGKAQTLTLSGYDNCSIVSTVLSMHSSADKGTGSLNMTVGSTTIASIADSKFFSPDWNGTMCIFYGAVTPNVTKTFVGSGQKVTTRISASESSLFCNKFAIYYEPDTTPHVSATSPVNASSSADNNGFISVSFSNVDTDNVSVEVFSDSDCTQDDVDWIYAEVNSTATGLDYIVEANEAITTTTPRTCYIKITAPGTDGINTATTVIKFTQAGKTVGGGGPTTSSITFSDNYNANTSLDGNSVNIDSNVTVSFNKNGGTAPQYYTTGTAVRCYAKNKITVTAEGKTISAITLTFGSSDGSNAITVNVGTFVSPDWSGSSESVTFTIGGSSGNRRLSGIEVTYE